MPTLQDEWRAFCVRCADRAKQSYVRKFYLRMALQRIFE